MIEEFDDGTGFCYLTIAEGENGRPYHVVALPDGHLMIYSTELEPDRCCRNAAIRVMNCVNSTASQMYAIAEIQDILDEPEIADENRLASIAAVVTGLGIRLNSILISVDEDEDEDGNEE